MKVKDKETGNTLSSDKPLTVNSWKNNPNRFVELDGTNEPAVNASDKELEEAKTEILTLKGALEAVENKVSATEKSLEETTALLKETQDSAVKLTAENEKLTKEIDKLKKKNPAEQPTE